MYVVLSFVVLSYVVIHCLTFINLLYRHIAQFNNCSSRGIQRSIDETVSMKPNAYHRLTAEPLMMIVSVQFSTDGFDSVACDPPCFYDDSLHAVEAATCQVLVKCYL